ncbi:hypothetical protein DNTS_005239 [Danionella cerebrum]|uniref:DNA-dependent metalloprotease SPRTN n=1 Tax=Danionella cerebrum TaxID=2873325 RepID=A0A553PUF8_9TELE|nr:hypothetical protein DNTS_005239 [Danionella translucida]
MEDEDFLLALRLQEQFDQQASREDDCPSNKKRRLDPLCFETDQPTPKRPLSVVDESWETLDPNPDVRAMFLEFNEHFFWGKLSGVEVKWSPRMTLCAGVCSYEGRGGLCSIRLSEPLLKLRPRRDLVQVTASRSFPITPHQQSSFSTLLHEMIHALLFVTQNNRDRDGHGPEFCKHMDRINQASGTNITIYHSFHDEVDVYRQHWWRCDGPCRNRRPFFGYVKRAMNRPPSARDPWWAEHQRTCGGVYTKVKEPENYGKPGKNAQNKKKPSSSGSKDIRSFIAFSGKGFVLGGNAFPPAASHTPPASLASPEQQRFNTLGSGTSRGLCKKSVGNSKAFISVNGSPVRVSKARAKPRSGGDLHKAMVPSSGRPFSSSKPATGDSSLNLMGNSISSTSASVPNSSGNTRPVNLSCSSTDVKSEASTSSEFHFKPDGISGKPQSKKRSREEHYSGEISDYFQRMITVEDEGSSVPGIYDDQVSSLPSQIMVHCPVCGVKVPQSTINEHLDSCLL